MVPEQPIWVPSGSWGADLTSSGSGDANSSAQRLWSSPCSGFVDRCSVFEGQSGTTSSQRHEDRRADHRTYHAICMCACVFFCVCDWMWPTIKNWEMNRCKVFVWLIFDRFHKFPLWIFWQYELAFTIVVQGIKSYRKSISSLHCVGDGDLGPYCAIYQFTVFLFPCTCAKIAAQCDKCRWVSYSQ